LASALRPACALSVMAMLLLAAAPSAVRPQQEDETEPPLGKDISARFKMLMTEKRAEIEEFIREHKLRMAQTHEQRLQLIQKWVEEHRQLIDEIKEELQGLRERLRDGLTEQEREELRAEMRELAAKLVAALRGLGSLGQQLSELNRGMAEENRARGQSLAEAIQALLGRAGETGLALGHEFSARGLKKPGDLPGPGDEADIAEWARRVSRGRHGRAP